MVIKFTKWVQILLLVHPHVKKIKIMISYYLRQSVVFVKIDHNTKEVINILNLPEQKTISKLNSEEYYNNIVAQVPTWTESDETTFNQKKAEVLQLIQVI